MNSGQKFNCIFCKETFSDKEALQIHFRKHGDPKFNQSKVKTENVAQSSTESVKNGPELVACDVCSDTFTTISKAITHKHKLHPDHDAKYFCPWCGKLFTLKHLYSKHLKSNHGNAVNNNERHFHCDACEVDFYLGAAMLYHNKFFHRQDTDIPPFGQSKKLKMFSQDVLQIYYCCFCGEEYNNKVNLHKHTNDDHSDENQSPDEVQRCPLCDAIFYHLDAYEVHLTFHSVDDMYTEKNELMKDITEFSLEAVPPTAEKVINYHAPEGGNSPPSEIRLEDLLQVNIDDQPSGKKKKHKKHKKSKKTITLDEFLTMNTDLFGEGLDIQGVEEVPTRVVTKRFKLNKKAPGTSAGSASDIEKLRKQGIIVKKKAGDTVVAKPVDAIPNVAVNKGISPTNVESSSTTDVLSRLMNKTNQIQIVKKSGQNSNNVKEQDIENDFTENNDIECDSTKKDLDEAIVESTSKSKDGDEKNTSNASLDNVESEKNILPDSVDTSTKFEIVKPSSSCASKNLDDSEEINTSVEENDKSGTSDTVACSSVLNVKKSNTNTDFENPKINKNDTDSDDYEETVNREENNKNQTKNNSLSALQHLSHLITVKPVVQPKTNLEHNVPIKEESVDENQSNYFDSTVSSSDMKKVPQTNTVKSALVLQNMAKSLALKGFSQKNDADMNDDEGNDSDSDKHFDSDYEESNNDPANVESSSDVLKSRNSDLPVKEDVEENISKMSSAQLLKNLTNITAKPINTSVNANKSAIKPVTRPGNVFNKNMPRPQQKRVTKDEDIEIFSIDDSDSDEADNNVKKTNIIPLPAPPKMFNKNVPIKPVTQPKIDRPNIVKNSETQVSEQNVIQNQVVSNSVTKSNIQKTNNENNSAIQQALKALGKNITIKSRNSSPSQMNTRDQLTNFDNEPNDDSDNESCSGKVKITEMNEDEGCEDESKISNSNQNAIVQTPDDDSFSDNDANLNDDGDFNDDSDVEDQIKTNYLVAKPKPNASQPLVSAAKNSALNTLKNVCKSVTIKSSSDNINKEEMLEHNSNADIPKNVNKVMRPNMRVNQSNNSSFTSVNQMSQNVATTNKEVTVKSFQTQTKTVIQEITTTVTKTIKTVNQTVKGVQNVKSSMAPNVSRIPGIRVNQPKNVQGTAIRQAVPTGIRARHITPVRATAPTGIRPSNQLVPVNSPRLPIRPSQNVARLSHPRMPVQRPRLPISNISQNLRPLKISPSAIISPGIKRSNQEEQAGPFSCFKKAKESLIPGSDVPNFNSDDSQTEYSSNVQMSKSNFSCTTKTVKGNAVVTSTQTKSEMSAHAQVNKLSNMTGLRVVKTSQNKQVQESNETSMKRTTLEAIEKLQKQGLLVKKPRVEGNDDALSEPGGEYNEDYDSEVNDD